MRSSTSLLIRGADDDLFRLGTAEAIELGRSSAIEAVGGSFRVHGDLTLMGVTHPLDVELAVDGDAARATAVVKQSSWGMKPYSTLFGALKVADDVEVAVEARLAT